MHRWSQTGALKTQQAGQEIIPAWRAILAPQTQQWVLIQVMFIDQEAQEAVGGCRGESKTMQGPRRAELPQPVDGPPLVDGCSVGALGPAPVQKDVEIGKQAPDLAPRLRLSGSAFLKIAGDGSLQVLAQDQGGLVAENLRAGIKAIEDVVIQQGVLEQPRPPTAKRLDMGAAGRGSQLHARALKPRQYPLCSVRLREDRFARSKLTKVIADATDQPTLPLRPRLW